MKRIITVCSLFICTVTLSAQSYDITYEKNGTAVSIHISDLDANIFEILTLEYTITKSPDTVFIERKVYFSSEIGMEFQSTGYSSINSEKGRYKLYPAGYGALHIPSIGFIFQNGSERFTIVTDPVPIRISSMMNKESKLLDLSVPDFGKKSSYVWLLITLIVIFISGTLFFTIFKLKKRHKKQSPTELFWNTWQHLHERKDEKKIFYNLLTQSLKKYFSYLSNQNLNSKGMNTCAAWVKSVLKKQNQLLHDFTKNSAEWDRIKFKRNHITDIYWRDDLSFIKKIVEKVEEILEVKRYG